jgi:MoaA/NifB/PqqE/SkfB family radical SAM enzyme
MSNLSRNAGMGLSIIKRMAFPEVTRAAVHITYDCNQRCKTCDIWQINKDKPELRQKEVTLKEFERFAEQNPRLLWICLTGGEPYLKKDMKGFLDACLGIPSLRLISISTNGSIPDKIESDVRHFSSKTNNKVTLSTQVSFEGPELLHDEVSGTPGSYKKALDTLGRLQKIAKEDSRIRYGIGFTLSSFNTGGFLPTVKSLGDRVPPPGQIQVSFGQRADYYHWKEDRIVEPDKAEWEREVKTFMSLTDWKDRIRDPYSLVEYLYYHKAVQLHNGRVAPKCVACQYTCTMDPYWEVHPCLFKFGQSLGNLKDHDFRLQELVNETQAKWKPMVAQCNKTVKCWTLCEDYLTVVVRPWRTL